jgi:hypothetical protein
MNWMQFVSSLVQSLAWPVAAVVIILIFRNGLSKRLGSLLSLTLPGGVEAKFSEDLNELEEKAEDAAPHPTDLDPSQPGGADLKNFGPPVPPPPEKDDRALKANPTGVVMEAWKSVESILRAAARRSKSDGSLSNLYNTKALIQHLRTVGFLDDADVAALEKARLMRNLAAHSEDPISPESAESFANISSKLAANFMKRSHEKYPS